MIDVRQHESVVLSGGGGYGAYEVGVLRALAAGACPSTGYRPLEAQTFAGTSVGSFNSAILAAHADSGLSNAVERLGEVWLDGIASRPGSCGNGVYRIHGLPGGLLDWRCGVRNPFGVLLDAARDARHFLIQAAERVGQFQRSRESLVRRVLESFDLSAFIDTLPFHALVRDFIPLDLLGRTERRLFVVATNFDKGTLATFTGKEMAEEVGHDAVLASAAVPGFFPPISIRGDLHIDGGTLMNTPILPATHGSDVLHVVYLDPDIEKIPIRVLGSTLGVIDRLLVTSFAFEMNQEIDQVRDFNRSIEMLERPDHPARSDPLARPLFALLDAIDARTSEVFSDGLTIHRYHPRDDLGGALGFLNFDHDHVAMLIDRGYRDAIAHDCAESGCALRREGVR